MSAAETIRVQRERRHWTTDQWRRVAGEEWPRAIAETLIAHDEAVDSLLAALAQYADARHWGIDRVDFVYPKALWIGPGADEKPVPNPMRIANEALREGA